MQHPTATLTDTSAAFAAAGDYDPAARRAARIRTAILAAAFLGSLALGSLIEDAFTAHNAARLAAAQEGGA